MSTSAAHSIPAQAAQILRHLKDGGTLTALQALDRFGCMRLGARVHELIGRGWQIKSRRVRVISERTGRPCKVAEYFLATESHA